MPLIKKPLLVSGQLLRRPLPIVLVGGRSPSQSEGTCGPSDIMDMTRERKKEKSKTHMFQNVHFYQFPPHLSAEVVSALEIAFLTTFYYL